MKTPVLSILIASAAALPPLPPIRPVPGTGAATFQVYDSNSCTQIRPVPGNILGLANTNRANQFSDSGCVSITFSSGKFTAFTAGFACDMFSDTLCKTKTQTFADPNSCDSFHARSLRCYDKTASDTAAHPKPPPPPPPPFNPFANVIVNVTASSTYVGTGQSIGSVIQNAIKNECTGAACDGVPFSVPYHHFNQNGQTSVSVTGSFENTDQRDYMAAIIDKTQEATLRNARVDTKGSSEDDDLVADQAVFFEVDIRNPDGSFVCNLIVHISTDVQPKKPGSCGLPGDVESLALGAIPAVGGLAAKAFNAVCANS